MACGVRGTALREAMAPLNEELETEYGTQLALRIGINAGEVVTGTEERLVAGDAVNLAARLEQAADQTRSCCGRRDVRARATGGRPRRRWRRSS